MLGYLVGSMEKNLSSLARRKNALGRCGREQGSWAHRLPLLPPDWGPWWGKRKGDSKIVSGVYRFSVTSHTWECQLDASVSKTPICLTGKNYTEDLGPSPSIFLPHDLGTCLLASELSPIKQRWLGRVRVNA